VVFSENSVKAAKQARNATGLAQERGCLNLSQLETVCVAAGKHLPTIVGQRPNKLHQGSTASNVLMQVSKPDFKEMNKVDFATKRTFLGEALVKDPSRSKSEDGKLGVGGEAMEPMSYHVMSHELMSLGSTL